MPATTQKAGSLRRERPGQGGGVRLTRRGRLVLIALMAMAVLLGLWMTAERGAAAGGTGRYEAPPAPGRGLQVVTVGGRDTLWDIAARNRPTVDPRVTVQRIIDLNALPGAIIQPGQRLVLPGR